VPDFRCRSWCPVFLAIDHSETWQPAAVSAGASPGSWGGSARVGTRRNRPLVAPRKENRKISGKTGVLRYAAEGGSEGGSRLAAHG
jgi:hypothetical protein